MLYINVLTALVELRVLSKLNSRLIINVNIDRRLCKLILDRDYAKVDTNLKVVNKALDLDPLFSSFTKGNILYFARR